MNDKGHNRVSEEKLVKVKETETGKERQRERGVQRSCGKGVVQGNEGGEREVVEGLYSFSFSCIEG